MITQALCWNQASPGFRTELALHVPGVEAVLTSPVPSLSSARGVVSVCLELCPSNTHKYPHSHTCASVQPCACSLACTHVGAPTDLLGHMHQCLHTWRCTCGSCSCTCTQCTHIWLCMHAPVSLCGKSLCLAGMCCCCAHTLVPVRSQGRRIWGPHARPGEMALGSPCPAEGGGAGGVSLCGGALSCPGHQLGPVSW